MAAVSQPPTLPYSTPARAPRESQRVCRFAVAGFVMSLVACPLVVGAAMMIARETFDYGWLDQDRNVVIAIMVALVIATGLTLAGVVRIVYSPGNRSSDALIGLSIFLLATWWVLFVLLAVMSLQ